ncbi:hypothetical protein NKI04_33330 [Mesorhizobium sp. M0814]|uniref:hypothetical protein n=1 Tax=Mesorhizobium sp. M0814 TaxID=2957004 RepID=UPI003336FA40
MHTLVCCCWPTSSRKTSAIRDGAATLCAAELAPRSVDVHLNEATDPSIFRELVMPACSVSQTLWNMTGLEVATLPMPRDAGVERIDSRYHSMMNVQSSLIMYY